VEGFGLEKLYLIITTFDANILKYKFKKRDEN
jgi:hypothetical protein